MGVNFFELPPHMWVYNLDENAAYFVWLSVSFYTPGLKNEKFLVVILNSEVFKFTCVILLLLRIPAATPWQTMPTKPCWRSSTITSSSSLVRVEQERRRPRRRFCSITLSAVRALLYLTPSGTKCSCPTLSSRSEGYLYHCNDIPKSRSYTNINECILLCFSVGFRQCQNTEKWQLKSIWEVYGHSVWQPGKN